jgi:hypothetical protein
MKFCKPTRGTKEEHGRSVTFDYVTLSDIKSHHGEQFLQQWKALATKVQPVLVDDQEVYYSADYKHIAYATDMFLNGV